MSVSGISSPSPTASSQIQPSGAGAGGIVPSDGGMTADSTGSSPGTSATYGAQSASPDSGSATPSAPPKKKHLLLWSIAIGTGLAAALIGTILLVKHLKKDKTESGNDDGDKTKQSANADESKGDASKTKAANSQANGTATGGSNTESPPHNTKAPAGTHGPTLTKV